MTIESFIKKHRKDLLRIYSEISTGREIEVFIDPKQKNERFDKSICLDSVTVLQYCEGIVDFPIKNKGKVTPFDELVAIELYSLAMCEDAVKKGELVRKGFKYAPTEGNNIKEPRKFGKYLITKD